MNVLIKFYRTRAADDAHALVGRESAEADDLDAAIALARRLARTLAMPQRPDALSISDSAGVELFAGALDAADNLD